MQRHDEPNTRAAERPLRRLLAGLALTAVAAAACSGATTTYESPGEIAREPAITAVTVPELASDPETYMGRVVTVSGEVNKVLGQHWFTIGGEDFGGKEVLVLGRMSMPALIQNLADSVHVSNDIVQVTGVVRVFEEDQLEREIPGIDLDGDIFDPFDAEPVIVMTELDITPRIDPAPVVAVPVPVPVGVPVVREIEIFVPDRASLAGRAAALYTVRVDSVLSNRAFWIGQGFGQRVLVVQNDSVSATPMQVNEGDMVYIAGVLRRVPDNLDHVRTKWGFQSSADAAIRSETIYLDAHRVEKVHAGSH